MRKSIIKNRRDSEADEYLELVRALPLRPIRDQASYARAGAVLAELISKADNPGLRSAQSDYADVLGRLMRDYDDRHATVLKQKLTPLELLKELMEQHSMTTTQLGELVGGKGLASMILNGKRDLSKANIRVLADHFKVSPALFL